MAKSPVTTIKLCIGSSCHLKGTYEISERIQNFLAANQAVAKAVEFMYAFCMDDCANGVCMTVISGSGKDQVEEKYRNVTAANVDEMLAMLLAANEG